MQELSAFQAEALRSISDRLNDRPVEVLADGGPADYGLTDAEAYDQQAALLAFLEGLADTMEVTP